MKTLTVSASVLLFVAQLGLFGTTFEIIASSDGFTKTFGGDTVETSETSIATTTSGGLRNHGIFEFDLSSIPSGYEITGASFETTLAATVSNTGGNPAELSIFGYTGDGIIDISDYSAPATLVAFESIAFGTSSGTDISFGLTDLAPVTDAFGTTGQFLTLRSETISFVFFNIHSTESSVDDVTLPTLVITAVPEPTTFPLLLGACALLIVGMRRRVFPTL